MQIPFAMLEFLASRPDGRATVDEFLKELKALKSRQSSEQFSDLDRVDALHAGLMVQENDGLRITEAGRSVLRAVEAFSNSSPDTEGFERSQSLNKIAELSDAEMRQKIFGVELRDADDSPARESLHEEAEIDQIVQPDSESPFGNRIEAEVAQTVGQSADERRDTNPLPVLAPSFKQEPGKLERPARPPSRSSARSTTVASNLKRLGGILRGHIEQEAPNIRTGARGGGIGGLVLSVLALLVIIICAGTYIAVAQIKSLKSEISGLEKELAPLKQQAAARTQQETKSKFEEKNAPLANLAIDKGRNPVDRDHAASTLVLSPDEVRLVREYIKPAPSTGRAAQPINVGDPVTAGTIPLPSPLTDKIPKLLGGRFTIANGSIVILKRDSRKADVVLAPN